VGLHYRAFSQRRQQIPQQIEGWPDQK